MTFTQRFIECDFSLAQGVFAGGGNTHTTKGLRTRAQVEKAGGVSLGGAQVEVYGMTLSEMNQLSTFGQVLTVQGKNTITVKAGEDPKSLAVVYMGTIASAYMDGQAQPDVPFRVEAYAGGYEQAKPVTPTSQPGSQDVAGLMEIIAQKAGLQFENNGVNVRLQNPYLPGTAVQQMRSLAEAARIEHIIDNGKLAIWPANGHRNGDAVLVSPQTGLVGYPAFNSMGIVVRTLFHPEIRYGGLIKVQSEITAACGTWRVYKLMYDLACMTPKGPWFCDVWAGVPDQTVVAKGRS